ncbi:hypothetical protein Tco_0331459 [Tanacetum coccineum]
MLHVFYLASGLKINIHKSNIYGIGVSNKEVSIMASSTGCALGSLPFTYLGLPIGSNMNLISNWQPLIDRFQSILSSWKANMLSIGSRLTLIKAVLGSLGIYYLSIFKAPELILEALERYRAIFFGCGIGGCILVQMPFGSKSSKSYMVKRVVLMFEVANLTPILSPTLFDRLLKEIRTFSQHENESLTDAWLRMKEMLRNFHGHNLSKGNIIKIFYHSLSKITQEVLNAVAGGNSNIDTDKIMTRIDAMTIKIDAQYKELQSCAKQPTPDLDDDDMPMSREEESKFMQTFRKTRFYNDYRDRDSNRVNWRSSGRNDYNRENYRSNTDDKPYDLQKQLNDFMKSQQSTNAFFKETFMDLKTQLETVAKNHQVSIQNLKTKFDRLADMQSGRPSGSLTSNTQPNP